MKVVVPGAVRKKKKFTRAGPGYSQRIQSDCGRSDRGVWMWRRGVPAERLPW